MAKILLIKCSEYDAFPFAIAPPMGLMYLSAVLKRDGGHNVKILDTRLGLPPAAQVARAALQFDPDIIGLGAILLEARSFHEYTAALQQILPRTPLVAGGPYPMSVPDQALSAPGIDCAVIGEGEQTFLELARAMEQGEDWSGLPGLAMMRQGRVAHTEPRKHIENLDLLPFPDWDAVDLAGYARAHRFSNLAPGPYMTVFTSRSCPFHCIYCHNIFGKIFRARSPENVFEEIKILYEKYRIRDFEVVDDCFNLDRDRAMAICDLIIQSGMKLRLSFPNGVRGDRMDRELIERLKAAGTRYMVVAIESASPRIQKLMRKNLDLERAKRAIQDITHAGIFCHGFFMIGFPTETLAEIRHTIAFASASPLHTASFFVVKPVPGTELHALAQSSHSLKNLENSSDFGYFSFNCTCADVPVDALRQAYRQSYLKFYLKPVRIMRIIASFPDKKHLLSSMLHLLARITGFRHNSKHKSSMKSAYIESQL